MHTFTINSGLVNLTDPCYSTDKWCGLYNVPAKSGTWNVKVETFSDRVSSWTAYHIDHENDHTDYLVQDFGVDSGQFGIFDASNYIGDNDDDERKWYFDICDCHDHCGNTIPDGSGFVSSSGYGDGGYSGYGAYEDGVLVKFTIVFIEEEEYEEEWDSDNE
jgi:hypothetical protein